MTLRDGDTVTTEIIYFPGLEAQEIELRRPKEDAGRDELAQSAPSANGIAGPNGLRRDISALVDAAVHDAGPDFDPVPLTLTLLLVRIESLLTRAHTVEFEPFDINGTQFNVMTVLSRASSPLTMKDLSRKISILPPHLTAVVQELEHRGLVERVRNPYDGRSLLVRASSAGRDLMHTFLPRHWEFLDQLYAGLLPDQRATLIDLLNQMLCAAETFSANGDTQVAPHVLAAARRTAATASTRQPNQEPTQRTPRRKKPARKT